MDEFTDLKFSTKFTKKLYEAALDALEDLNHADSLEKKEEIFVVWSTIIQILEYSMESFVQLNDPDDKQEFLQKMRDGINNIPENIEQDDILKNTPYTKKNLPQA